MTSSHPPAKSKKSTNTHADFNPAKYKVAQLRGVLVQNDVTFPSGAKKQDLIDLFNEHVKPTAAKRLKTLNAVVPNHDDIEVVEKPKKAAKEKSTIEVTKKRKASSRATTADKSTPEPEGTSAPRRSPRKVSKSKTEEEDNSSDAKIGVLPDLKKTKSKVEKPSTRGRSPRRAASKSKTVLPPPPPPARDSDSTSDSDSDSDSSSDSDSDSDVKKEPFVKKSALKETDRDASFSHENVFQSPMPSSPPLAKAKKVIPKKRSAVESPVKSVKKTSVKPIRKTAFSSSPTQEKHTKSPSKKALEISKFEASSPDLGKGHGIFDSLPSDPPLPTDTSLKNYPPSSPKQEAPKSRTTKKTPVVKKLQAEEAETFITPNDGNASRITLASSPPPQTTPSKTPSVTRRSLVPDFSQFKVSTDFAKSISSRLSSTFTPEKKTEDPVSDEKVVDHELLDSDEEDDEDKETSRVNSTMNGGEDSSLLNLQNEIDSANDTVLREAEDATRLVNEVFTTEEVEAAEALDKREPLFTWYCLFDFVKQMTIFLGFVSVVVFGLWYREQRILVGYCGSEIYQPTFPNTENVYLNAAQDFLDSVKPECLPCPDNAICLPSMKIKCKQDYIAHEPWYKLYGLLPFSDYCLKDQEKENIINEVVSKSLDLLRTRNAGYKCGDGEDLEVGISSDELYDFFYRSKKNTISDSEFNALWEKVLKDLENDPEITVRQVVSPHTSYNSITNTRHQVHIARSDSSGSTTDDVPSDEDEEETDLPQEQRRKVIFRSTSQLKLSISCKFKKEIYERFAANKYYILIFTSVFVAIGAAYYAYLKRGERLSKVREISGVIITKLQKQQQNSIKDTTGLTNRYLSAIQLRDELLSTMTNSKKFQLWDSILAELERNSNIRSSTKEIHGEIVRVLEWIGE